MGQTALFPPCAAIAVCVSLIFNYTDVRKSGGCDASSQASGQKRSAEVDRQNRGTTSVSSDQRGFIAERAGGARRPRRAVGAIRLDGASGFYVEAVDAIIRRVSSNKVGVRRMADERE